jgi:adenine specific DNA methylase Mod
MKKKRGVRKKNSWSTSHGNDVLSCLQNTKPNNVKGGVVSV